MANLPYPVHDSGILPIPEPEGIIGAGYTDSYPPSAPITSDNYSTSSSPYSSAQSSNIYSDAHYQDSAYVSASNTTPYSAPNTSTPYSAPSSSAPYSAPNTSAPYSQPYPVNNSPYPSQPSQSYPAAYPNANAPYPGNNSPYPAVNQPYPPSNAPYSQPYSSTDAPYQPYPQQTNMPPYPQGNSPYPPVPPASQQSYPYNAPTPPSAYQPGGYPPQPLTIPYNNPTPPGEAPYQYPSSAPPYPGANSQASGYPPFPGPTGGSMYPPGPPGGNASPPGPTGGSMYPPGPPGGSAYPPGLPDAPSTPPYQDFEENMMSSNSKEGKLRSGLKKLVMKSETVQAGIKKVDKMLKELQTFKQSGRPSHFYHARIDPRSPVSPDPPADVPDTPKYFGHIKEKTIEAEKFKNQDYRSIKKTLSREGRKFEDPMFNVNSMQLGGGGHGYMRTMYQRNEIKWLRPSEIIDNPVLFDKDINRFDINQGEIGDCWFLASLAILAEKKEYFRRVVPYRSAQDAQEDFRLGIFRFKFYSFNKWTEVVIDDRLPTRNGKLIYLKSGNPREFWSPLLEKAYAKLYGGYKQLEGGLSIEASVDFTGGIPEVINLTQLNETDKKALFDYMKEASRRDAFMTCSLSNSYHQSDGVRKGLQARHAYTISMVVDVRGTGRMNIPLIRLRNPHGNHNEWTGDWSDRSSQWNQIDKDTKRKLNLTIDSDGEFYMNFDRDFLKYFGEVEIVHQTKNVSGVGNYQGKIKAYHYTPEVLCFTGAWKRSRTAGGCGNDGIQYFAKNPQFMFSIQQPYNIKECPVVISLAQRPDERKQEYAIGFRVYKLKDLNTPVDEKFLSYNMHVAKTDAYTNMREVSIRITLTEGSYVIIPSTFNRGEEAQFLLRLFFDSAWKPKEVTGSGQASGGRVIPIQRSFYSRGGDSYIPVHQLRAAVEPLEGGIDTVDDLSPEPQPITRQMTVCESIFEEAVNSILSNPIVKRISRRSMAKVLYIWPQDSESELEALGKILSSLKTKQIDRKSIREQYESVQFEEDE